MELAVSVEGGGFFLLLSYRFDIQLSSKLRFVMLNKSEITCLELALLFSKTRFFRATHSLVLRMTAGFNCYTLPFFQFAFCSII